MNIYFKEADKTNWITDICKAEKGRLYTTMLSGTDITEVKIVKENTYNPYTMGYCTFTLAFTLKNGQVIEQEMPALMIAQLLMIAEFDKTTKTFINCPFHFENIATMKDLDYRIINSLYIRNGKRNILLVPTLLYEDKTIDNTANTTAKEISTKDIGKGVFQKDKIYVSKKDGNNFVVIGTPYKSTILKKYTDKTCRKLKTVERDFIVALKLDEKNPLDIKASRITSLSNECKLTFIEKTMSEDLKNAIIANEATFQTYIKTYESNYINEIRDQLVNIYDNIYSAFINANDEIEFTKDNRSGTHNFSTQCYAPSFKCIYPQISFKNAKDFKDYLYSSNANMDKFKNGEIFTNSFNNQFVKMMQKVYIPKIYSSSMENAFNHSNKTVFFNNYHVKLLQLNLQLLPSEEIAEIYKIKVYKVHANKVEELFVNENGLASILQINPEIVASPDEKVLEKFKSTITYPNFMISYDKKTHTLNFANNSDNVYFLQKFLFNIGTEDREQLEDNIEMFSKQDNLDTYIVNNLNNN